MALENFKGKVVLLKFFATDCPHCQRVAGEIMPIYKELRSRGLEVLAVAIDPDAKQRVPEFVERFGLTYPVALGNPSVLKTFASLPAGKLISMPYIFLIDRRGSIRFEHEGRDQAFYSNTPANLHAELDVLLGESASTRKPSR